VEHLLTNATILQYFMFIQSPATSDLRVVDSHKVISSLSNVLLPLKIAD
jgi:hypothetical protein